jgi:DNA repair protein RecN (Recombination protein N)
MLVELRIQDFAIIDQLELRFHAGLVTFTGETGAGKSIIIDAVEAVMGGRVDVSMLRAGAERAAIEAEFKIPAHVRPAVHQLLLADDLLDDPDFVTLAREIRAEGRHLARVNGRTVRVSLLKDLGEYLVDVHGQSEHLSLLRVREQLRLLDSFAGSEDLLNDYQGVYRELRKVRADLQKLRESDRDAARRADLLSYQINEIEAAGLKTGEDDELRDERNRLANAETLSNLVQESLANLDDGDPEFQPISDLLGQVVEALRQLSRLDPSQRERYEQAQGLFDGVADLALELRDYGEEIEFNPRRLEQVEIRLDLIHNLKRKYGSSIEDVLGFARRAAEELDAITNAEERIEALEKEEKRLLEEIFRLGQALYARRETASRDMSDALEKELQDLNMSGAQFGVEFKRQPDPDGVPGENGDRVAFGPYGLDMIQFLVAPNPGEGLKPLAKIASGGEMSRLMLALKKVLATADPTPTLVFDEIDQGIGGRIGAVVGEKLWQLSNRHQVLCITHLPQLAAYGTQHYRVEKQVTGGRTSTRVEALEGEERISELAQMLGEVSEGTLQSAREILQSAGEVTSPV